jgi:hypothetical protein
MDIVFVHLNTPIPIYLKHNLIHTKNIFPKEKIILISNLDQKPIPGVTLKILDEPKYSRHLSEILSHPKEFRQNFWHSSIARFIYILSYQKKIKRRILHLESDVLVARDFPLLKFADMSVNKIAFPILAKKRGVASVFYSGSQKALEKFVSFSISEALKNSRTTDMIVLRNYFNIYPSAVKLLPAGPNRKEYYSNAILNDIFPEIQRGILEFEGIFDGSDLGIYFFGTNPWNKRGITILQKEIPETYTKMTKFKIEFNSSRDFFDLIIHDHKIPIYNMHITSKREKFFMGEKLQEYSEKFINAQGIKSELIPKIFIGIVLNKLKSLLSK